MAEKGKIVVSKNGPYIVSGGLPLDKETIKPDNQGTPCDWEVAKKYPDQEKYSLCRCGKSENKPYCDGSHTAGFDGTETASKEPYSEQARVLKGPDLILTDAQDFCVGAGFCHRNGGTWHLTEKSDDPEARKTAIKEACDCPSGRLVACEKTGKPIEPDFKQSITVVEQPIKGVSGPLWVKGYVPIESADGSQYEKRNRVTLCRCGKSENKPFCDGMHIDIKFNDGDESLKKKSGKTK
ncbi:MAG: CDGSH iron-sulfur domain-containing protein [Candidatus Woesearchaeota archaeon]